MCANKDEHQICLCLLSCMILLGWWLWPGPEADEHDWYTAHLNMLYGPLECILQHLCEYIWKDELSLIEKPEFSLILQVLAFVCCLWLLCLADVEPLPCTHTTCETVNGRQLALAINNGIFDIWGVVFNSIMSEDVPCAYEHPVHGAAVTFDTTLGRFALVPFNTKVAWSSDDVVVEYGGPGLFSRHSGNEKRERDAAEKHGLRARGKK